MKIQVKTAFEKPAMGRRKISSFLRWSLLLLVGLLIVACVAGSVAAFPPLGQIQEIWDVLEKASAELASITESDFPEDHFRDNYPLGFWKLTVFREIARFQERVRDQEGLRKTARRAEDGSKDIPIWHDGFFLAWIAEHQLKAGDQDGAVVTLKEALVRASKYGIENFPDGLLEEVIKVQALAGETELAYRTFQWLEQPSKKALSLSHVAFSYAQKKEDFEKVSRLFQEAIQESKKISNMATKVRVLLTIAQQQSEAELLGEVRKTVSLARATIGASVKEDTETVGSLGYLALLQMKYSDTEEGKETLMETIRRADALPKKADAAVALQNLAWRQIVDGDKDGARKTLEYARQAAEGIGDKDLRAIRLRNVGTFYGLAGEIISAKKILFEVLEYHLLRSAQESQSEDLFGVVYALLGLPNLTENENARIQNVILGLVDENSQKARHLAQLVRAQVLVGEIEEAEDTRKSIVDAERRAKAAQSIGAAKGGLGNLQDALRWVSSLDHPYSRARGFLGVAGGLLEKQGLSTMLW